ncbi:hypothetical protein D3C76_1466300 [compost metagenome]
MIELNIWELLRNVQCVIHIAKTGRKDNVMILCKLGDDPLGIRSFRNVLYGIRCNSKLLLHFFTTQIMLVSISAVTRRSNVNEGYL